MIPSPQLTLDRKEVERVIKHFLDTGHQFHSAPDKDPELARAERRYARWIGGVIEALSRCFTTNDIAQGFSDCKLTGEESDTSESDRQYHLKVEYGYRLEYLKRLKGTLAIYEVQQTEPPSSVLGKYTDREPMERAIELSRKCVSEEGNIGPKVGAIVARNGVILGEAFRGEMAPGEHAEYTLLERKLSGETLAGATLFTTLEPCTSRNKPKLACAQRVIERRLGKVVIGTLDRNQRIRGKGEVQLLDAGIQIAKFDPDLLPVIEELNRDFLRQVNVRKKRTPAETKDPVPEGEVGPNGFKIGYNEDGDKVEWIEEDGEIWPMVLRRNDNHILEELSEHWDRVWYVRKLIMFENMESGKEERKPEHEPFIKSALKKMKKMEKKFGAENLVYGDVEWGIMQGKMAALAWVMGSDWEGAFDT